MRVTMSSDDKDQQQQPSFVFAASEVRCIVGYMEDDQAFVVL